MANYNTFVIVDTRSRRPELVTSSPSKANKLLRPGYRCEVWNNNHRYETIYTKTRVLMLPYLELERQYHRQKQERRNHAGKNLRNREQKTKVSA